MDELLADIGLSLSAATRFKQWFTPVVGSHYRHLSKRLLKRLEVERR